MLEKIITSFKEHPTLIKGVEKGALLGYTIVSPITMVLSDLTHKHLFLTYKSVINSIFESFQPDFLSLSLFYTSASAITGGFIGHFWDKSIKIEKEKIIEVKKSSEMFNNFFNESSTGFHMFDQNGIFIKINDFELNMIGYSQEEIIGKKTLKDLIISNEYSQFEKHLAEINNPQIGGVKDLEYTLICKNGEYINVLLNASGKFDDNGNLINTQGNIIDITDRKKNEAKIENLETAIEQSSVSVVITNSEGKIEYVNSGFTQITGYSLKEVLGENPRILKSKDTCPKEFTQLWKTILSGKIWKGEFKNKKKSGGIYSELVTISPIKNLEGKITNFMKVGEDITKRKNMEIKLKEYKNEMDDDLILARKMIEEELPKKNQKLKFTNISYLFEPMLNIGGDILNYRQLSKNELLFTIADVSGHGISAALLALKYNNLFEEIVTSYFEMNDDPIKYKEILDNPQIYLNQQISDFNNKLCKNSKKDEILSTNKHITSQLGYINNINKEFYIVDSGHTPLIHFNSKKNKIEMYNSSKKNRHPLGWFSETIEDLEDNINRTLKIKYETGDIFVLHSDGIFETQNEKNKMFGLDKLEKLIHYSHNLTSIEIVEKINKEIEIFRGENNEIEDDMSLMVMKMK